MFSHLFLDITIITVHSIIKYSDNQVLYTKGCTMKSSVNGSDKKGWKWWL